jgi:subtilase family serine protease
MRRITAAASGLVMLAALLAPGMALAGSGEHFAHPFFHVRPQTGSAPSGLSPATIKSAYAFTTSGTAGAGKTIAIVDA